MKDLIASPGRTSPWAQAELIDLYDHPVLIPEMLSLEAERKALADLKKELKERDSRIRELEDIAREKADLERVEKDLREEVKGLREEMEKVKEELALRSETLEKKEAQVTELEENLQAAALKAEELMKGLKKEEVEEVKSVLKVLDDLLGKLDEKVVEEFVKSGDYETYEKLFKKLGV